MAGTKGSPDSVVQRMKFAHRSSAVADDADQRRLYQLEN
jgi:hypothetical protein